MTVINETYVPKMVEVPVNPGRQYVLLRYSPIEYPPMTTNTNTRGDSSSVGRAPGCGPGCRGFDPRLSPHKETSQSPHKETSQ